MAKVTNLSTLGEVIGEELKLYTFETNERVYKAGQKAVKELERITRDTAPFDAQAYHRHYVDLIATKSERRRTGVTVHTWYVKPPGHRLTHLLAKGHQTRDGGRTRADPFLENALAKVLPQYEKDIEEALNP